MPEPTTPNVGLIVPNTGDLVGAWGTSALNVNWQQLDGLFGGVLNLSFSTATTVALSTSGASLTPGAGPNQSNNAAIICNGALTGNVVIQLSQPGHYTIVNACTGTTHYVSLSPASGPGASVGLPPGETWRALYDGTSVRLLGMPHVGSYHDFGCAGVPAWMNGWTVSPYLFCNGSVFPISSFPYLGGFLGNTFGGDGVTTFAVPDLQNRYRIPLDLGGNNRITVGGSGINGAQFGALGGSELLHQHSHPNVLTDFGHFHEFPGGGSVPTFSGGGTPWQGGGINGTISQTAPSGSNITITNANAGSGFSQNIPPGVVSGMTFIKT